MGRVFSAALALVMFAGAAVRADEVSLQGEWQVIDPNDPTYSAIVQIDAERRVVLTVYRSSVVAVKSVGYVRTTVPTVEILITAGKSVARSQCTVQSSDLLHCYDTEGTARAASILKRIGPGPATLMPAPR